MKRDWPLQIHRSKEQEEKDLEEKDMVEAEDMVEAKYTEEKIGPKEDKEKGKEVGAKAKAEDCTS